MTADFRVQFHTQPSLRGTANSEVNIVSQGTSLVAQWLRLWACTAKANLGDRVSGEVEKNSFIALQGKKGHSGLQLQKLCVPSREDLKNFIATIQGWSC